MSQPPAHAKISLMDLEQLRPKVDNLPTSHGVYLLKDKEARVIYVGKANNLRSRVRSYLAAEGDGRFQIRFLQTRLADLEVIVTDTEKEALILENNLIKQYRPRYNVRLRDDKTYFHLVLTTSEKYPRLLLARRPSKNKDLVFGPFSSSSAVKQTIYMLQEIFPLRRCTGRKFSLRERPCLNYEINKCLGPCAEDVSEEDYQAMVREVLLFLKGRRTELAEELNSAMLEASEAREYEKAAVYRDRLRAIEATIEPQKVEAATELDRDVFGFYREGDRLMVHRLGFRSGLLLISKSYSLNRMRLDDEEVLGSLVKQLYTTEEFIPPEVLLPFGIEDAGSLAELMSETRGTKVNILVPVRGQKKRLVEMAQSNARETLKAALDRDEQLKHAIGELKRKLRLPVEPRWVECYDISNIMGQLAVGSMVKFQDGEPDKSGYRRFRIKSVDGSDDYAMMNEVLTRRFKRALSEGQELPDLLVMDGGKGQLNIALSVLDELGVQGVSVVSLAKPKVEKARGEEGAADKVYLPRVKDPVRLARNSAGLHLLQRLRDESHRFAITYHRSRRKKSTLRSALEDIPGIGPKKQKNLLRHLGSLKRIKEAGIEELTSVPGIGKAEAQKIRNYLHGPGVKESD